jgi:CheY-like chemotaxis protein
MLASRPPRRAQVHAPMEPEHILIVEDDADIAELLAVMLTQEGYSVATAPDAATGLAALRTGRFALVLASQRTPEQPGIPALRAAQAAGLLDRVAVLVINADAPDLAGTPWRALRRPVDFDHIIDEVHRAMVARAELPDPSATARQSGAAMHVLELVLYVTAGSASSRRAQRNLERVLAQYDAAGVSLRLIDLSLPDSGADPEDRVAFTPTLVKRGPGTRAWLLGDLRDPRALRALLEDAGVARRTT